MGDDRRPLTLADTSAAALCAGAAPFVPKFDVSRISSIRTLPQRRVEFQFETRDGNHVEIGARVDELDAIIANLLAIRDAAAREGSGDTKLLLINWERWETGLLIDGSVVLTFDRGTNAGRSFAFPPETAREAGRALVRSARDGEIARTKHQARVS